MSDIKQPNNLTLTPGERLKLARESKGLSLADVAGQLRLSQQYVIDIEKDDYKHAPGLIYVRGYLRSYARLLELSEEQILAAFDALKIEHLFESTKVLEPPVYKQRSRIDYRKYLLAGGGVTIFLLLLLMMMFHGLHKKHVQQAQVQTTSVKSTQQLALKSDTAADTDSDD